MEDIAVFCFLGNGELSPKYQMLINIVAIRFQLRLLHVCDAVVVYKSWVAES